MKKTLTIVVVGAHPDDCEYAVGGLTIRYRQSGHKVVYISMTNGDAGHHQIPRDTLKQLRYEESRRVAKYLDIDYEIFDIHDCQLLPTLDNRDLLIRTLRKYQPDVVITHPIDDYHPDHRYTCQLVMDTAYLLSVPLVVPDAPVTRKDVVYCHVSYRPGNDDYPFVIIPVDAYMDKKLYAFHQNTSQVYQWLPWTKGIDLSSIPQTERGRLEFLKDQWSGEWAKAAVNYRNTLKDKMMASDFIEVLTISPLGAMMPPEKIYEYFPFEDALYIRNKLP